MSLLKIERFERKEAKDGPLFHLAYERTNICVRFWHALQIMKIKESMKGHTERRSPGGGGDGPGVCLTAKQLAGGGGGIVRTS
jgi:hypothetical protein